MKIGIDAGHRSTTPGKRTPPMPHDVDVYGDGSLIIKEGEQYHEHVASVGVCVKLDSALSRCGLETAKIAWNDANGTDDETLDDLGDRQEYVKEQGCNLLISIHWNAYGDGMSFTSPEGVETYYHSDPNNAGDSNRLASKIQKFLIQGSVQENRGVKNDAFAMCDCEAMKTRAAVLTELAFMTNEREAVSLMANASFWKESAEEICKGVCDYLGISYVPEEEEEDNMIRYAYLKDIPNDSGFRDIINKLMDAKIINGDGSDPDGNGDLIDLSHDQVRSLVFEYRGGAFDRKFISMGMTPAVSG